MKVKMRDPENVFVSREMHRPATEADSSHSSSVSGKMKNRSDRERWEASYSARLLLAAALILMCGHIASARTTGSTSGTAIGKSNSNAFQTSLHHTSGRLEFLVGYSYSKSLDQSSGLGDQVNALNYKLTKTLSAFDMTHNFATSYRYELPFDQLYHNGRLSKGWIPTGVIRFATGLPITLYENDDMSLLGTAFTVNANQIDEPNFTPGSLHFTGRRTGQPYFNRSLFTLEALGQLGSASRRFFHGPGLNNFDLALMKQVPITESKALQFRAELFSVFVFNHAQFPIPLPRLLSDTSCSVGDPELDEPRIGVNDLSD